MRTTSKLVMMATAALMAGTLAAASQSVQPGGGAQEKGSSGSQMSQPGKDQPSKALNKEQSNKERATPNRNQAQSKEPTTSGQAKSKNLPVTTGQKDKEAPTTNGQAPGGREENRAQSEQDKKSQGQTQREHDRQQRSGGVSASFTPEQRTKIREVVLRERDAPRMSRVDFSLNVGTVVPRTVRVVAVPEVIVEVHPEWRGFRYFLVNEQLVIVEPDTLRIVAIVDV
jgi:DNA mismatch repair ATPase MutL